MCALSRWSRTTAWGAGGYYGRIFVNVAGREPQGVVPAEQYESFRRELAADLASIPGPAGEALGTRVFTPQEAYAEVREIAPDLIVYFGDLAWRSVGSVGNDAIHVFENDTGPDDANHAQNGMYIIRHPEAIAGRCVDHTWRAIAPTMLDVLGLPVPGEMDEERLS